MKCRYVPTILNVNLPSAANCTLSVGAPEAEPKTILYKELVPPGPCEVLVLDDVNCCTNF